MMQHMTKFDTFIALIAMCALLQVNVKLYATYEMIIFEEESEIPIFSEGNLDFRKQMITDY